MFLIQLKNLLSIFGLNKFNGSFDLRINRRHGKLKVAGRAKSPLRTAERSDGTVGARNGIFPITIKYNSTPLAHTSTGPPTYESSLNTERSTAKMSSIKIQII